MLLSLVMVLAFAAGCQKQPPTETEKPADPTKEPEKPATPLVVAYNPFNQKFSPFFADTAYDMDVAAMTQLTIMTYDRTGAIVFNAIEGETRNFNGTDYTYHGPADLKVEYKEAEDKTVYTVKIREDLKFSDGEPVTINDLIFSYYVFLDNSFAGATTLNTYPIVGYMNYKYDNSNAENTVVTPEEVDAAINNPSDTVTAYIKENIIVPTLTGEVDWVKSIYGNPDYESYTTAEPVAKDLFAMFYSLDENYDSHAVEDEAKVLEDIIAQYGVDFKALGANYAGDENYFVPSIKAFVEDALMKEKLAAGDGTPVDHIEGIKKIDEYTVEVTLTGFSAPAIYQICGLQIAPLHYYGDASVYDYDAHKFGFPRGDVSGVEAKNANPLGAGPYKFVEYSNRVVYFEANDLYFKGAPKTKEVQFKETESKEVASGVQAGTVDGGEMTGSKERFAEVRGYNSNGEITGDVITTSKVDNLGYGYIGLNADTVNVGGQPDSVASRNLRKAIATVLSVYRAAAIESYYVDAAEIINYPISNTSWAAPRPTDEDYKEAFSTDVTGNPVYTAEMNAEQRYEASLQAALGYFEAAGYTVKDGKLTKAPAGAKLSYLAMIPGDGTGDHPSFAILTGASEAFKKIGFDLAIKDYAPTEQSVFWDTLDAGTQEIWCAAWGATIDPDMYQVYSSTGIPGKGGSDSNHYHIADAELDQLMLDARTSDDQSFRKSVYKQCLDIIIDWAVEIPIYQRQNCIIFSSERVNIDTVTPDITTYWGWLMEIELLEMN